MQTNILWSGIEYHSMENCIVDVQSNGIAIHSVLLGFYQHKIYQVDYTLQLDRHWNVYSCHMQVQLENKKQTMDLNKKENKWFVNGTYHPEFDGCLDVDIPLTPLTNSLPINRLRLETHQEYEIDVLYIDVLEQEIKHVKQKYKRLSDQVYHYENIPNDFEADIQVDTHGFVIDYPQLFKQTASVQSHYSE